ncbi:MAG: ABC transporter ATP-binding protein [bacterium]
MEKTLTYKLNSGKEKDSGPKRKSAFASFKEFYTYIKEDRGRMIVSFTLIVLSAGAGIVTPYIIAKIIDIYIASGKIEGLGRIISYLIVFYMCTSVIGYFQEKNLGAVSQRTLFRLRQALFLKLQNLPIAFFTQNKAGDLMSRINNDTEKLNNFLSQTISRLMSGGMVTLGIGVFLLCINTKLALVMLSSVLLLVIITTVLAPTLERLSKKSLQAIGALSASLQENIFNFRVVIAFNKRSYFKKQVKEATEATFKAGVRSNSLNKLFEPIYDLASGIAMLTVIWYGLSLVGSNQVTLGVLIGFIIYTQRFYDPLRTLATLFANVQQALASWSRISEVLALTSNLRVLYHHAQAKSSELSGHLLEIRNVSFKYEESGLVLEKINLVFDKGKTYALVGPTGGGKSTLASLIARLYDPTEGEIFLEGKDIRTFTHNVLANKISVILQDPILFTGTVAENIKYGNEEFANYSDADMEKVLVERGFVDVLKRFEKGLSTAVSQSSGSGLSLGQKQLISFMRAVLRQPELLILDEATANIDTITENFLNESLNKLPADTTKIIIAHRLNTIKEADEIMFVNGHHVVKAGNFHEAVDLIEKAKRSS